MATKNHPSSQIIRSYERKALKKRPVSVKVADVLTSFFGSLLFLSLNFTVFTLWVLANLGYIPGVPIFDPYPFVLLITAVSLEAIILTTIVLMSQNRQAQISAIREEMALQIELAAEREITKILKLLKKLIEEHKIKITDPELSQMLEDLDSSYIEKSLEEQIMGKPKNHRFKKLARKMVDSAKTPLSPKKQS